MTGGADAPDGAPLDGIDEFSAPTFAAALELWQWSDDPLKVEALAYWTHSEYDTGYGAVTAEQRRAQYVAGTPQDIKDAKAAMEAEAATLAGPYAAVQGANSYTAYRRTGVVQHVVPVMSDAGRPIAGKPFTITLNGPAVIDSNNNGVADAGETNSWSGASTDAEMTFPWVATGTGSVTYRISTGNVGRTHVSRFYAGTKQATASFGNRSASDPSEITSPEGQFEAVLDFQPVATSKVVTKVVNPGEATADTLTVSTKDPDAPWIGETPVVFEGTKYSTGLLPAVEAAAVPAGATVLGTTTITATGPGEYTSPELPAAAEGQFETWVWRVVKANQPAEVQPFIRGDWTDGYGIADETDGVRDDTVVIDSDLSVRTTKSGDRIVDDLYVEGLPDDYPSFEGGSGFGADTQTIVHTLYWFPGDETPTDEELPGAIVLGTVETPARNGFYPSVGSTDWKVQRDEAGNNLPGGYAIVSTLAESDRVKYLATSAADPAEQLIVRVDAPALSTQLMVDEGSVTEGGKTTIHDVVKTDPAKGPIPAGAVTTVDYYMWPAEGAPICTDETKVGTVEITHTEAVAPGTSVDAPSVTIDKVTGTTGAVETTTTGGQKLSGGQCGETSETIEMTKTPTPTPTLPAAAEARGGAAQTGTLAHTGATIGWAVGSAALLTALGAILVMIRRRNASAVSATE
jgi:hypothetical protein